MIGRSPCSLSDRSSRSRPFSSDHLNRVRRSTDQERQFVLFRPSRSPTEYVAGDPFLASVGLADSAAHPHERVPHVLNDRSQTVVPTVTAADLDAKLAERQVDLVVDDDRRRLRLDLVERRSAAPPGPRRSCTPAACSTTMSCVCAISPPNFCRQLGASFQRRAELVDDHEPDVVPGVARTPRPDFQDQRRATSEPTASG